MSLLSRGLGALALVLGLSAGASADNYCAPSPHACYPYRPTCLNFAYYPCGGCYGQNYAVCPPACLPYQGPITPPQIAVQPKFQFHNYARSPRDFFMLDLN